jgi:hypothetical protein
VWAENRDPRTLFDLYASSSRDGTTWAPSRRLNDDEEPAFSVHPMAIDGGRAIHVVAEDYRETNRFGDRDADVYHTSFRLDERAPTPGVRINDVRDAPQHRPSVIRDRRSGALVAAWLDLRQRLTGDVLAAVSSDGGASWSANRRVSETALPTLTSHPLVAPRPEGGAFVLWRESRGDGMKHLVRLVEVAEPAAPARGEPLLAAAATPAPTEPPVPPATLVLEERFDRGSADGFTPLSGSWIVHDGALLGFDRGMAVVEWTRAGERADFVLEGRFRLDRRYHLGAHVFLRMRPAAGDETVLSGVHVRTHFRRGVYLSHARLPLGHEGGPPFPVVEPLADRWHPVLQGRWYDFRLVVSGRRLDSWLDGQHLLTWEGLDTGPGTILFAADPLAPVEWDDLRLSAIAASSASDSR